MSPTCRRYKRATNTVFQNYALFPHLTVFENIAFGLRRRRSRTTRSATRCAAMLELVELPGYEERKPTQLSGGQQQRIALARALVNNPQVLLLDEPLGALDLKLRKQMQIELKRIQSEVGITFIFVTHDQEEAMTMSDRIAVMRAGRIEQLGHAGGALRAPGDRLRRRLPGRQQPARRRGRRPRRSLLDRAPGRRHDPPRAGLGAERRHRGAARRPPREAARHRHRRRGRAASDGDSNAIEGHGPRRVVHGRQHPVPGRRRDGHRLTVYAQNLETAGAGEVLADGQRVRLTWKPQHTFVIGGVAEHVADDPHVPEEEGATDE